MYRLDFKLQWHGLIRKRIFVLNPINEASAPFWTATMDNTSSNEVFKLALTWIAECRCVGHLADSSPWRPTRLIDLSDLKSGVHSAPPTSNNGDKRRSEKLHIGTKNHPGDMEVRLVDTRTEVQNNKSYYVTLSHKWGSVEGKTPLKLTNDNLEDFKRGLRLRDLPKTFRNVMEFSARLENVQYIWIDSLCIIQDSAEDWLIESSQMHRVYSQSFLNISATAAEHSHQGLHSKRNPKLLWETEFNLNIEGLPASKAEKKRAEGIYRPRERECSVEAKQGSPTYDLDRKRMGMSARRREHIRRCTLIDASYYERLVNQASVNRRGWVLQERLLAPRVLHFCQGQIAWECPERSAAEGIPWGLPTFQRRRDDTLFNEIPLKGLEPLLHGKALRENRLQVIPEPDLHLLQDPTCKERLYALEIWTRIVQIYSKTELSYGKDKLPALSGIANRMSESIDCDYIAGLWNWNLPSQLLWKVEPLFQRMQNGTQFSHPGKRAREVKSGARIYRAPSFSWASIDSHESDYTTCGEVTDRDILVVLESAVISQAPEQRRDRFGQILGGHVTLWGHVFNIRLYKRDLGRHVWKFEPGDLSIHGDVVPKGLIEEEHANVYLDCPDDDDADHSIFSSEDIYCLPVALGERVENKDGKYVICLLLQRELCTPRVHGFGTFRRIGLTKLSSWAEKHGRRYMLQCVKSSTDEENRQDSESRQRLLYIV